MLRVLVRARTVGLLASPVAPLARRAFASMAASASDATSTAPEATTSDSPTGASARRVRIYTRTGDKGSSSLYNGKRRPKDDAVFDALGDVDELNATLGVAREHALLAGVAVADQLLEIQSRLMDVGTAVATPLDSSSGDRLATAAFDSAHATQLERWIDELDAHVPPLRNFILPGGGLTSAHLHHSRTVCRRAERSVVGLVRDGAVPSEVGIFLNRLSDFLFVAARFAAHSEGKGEVIYKKAVAATTHESAGSGGSGGSGGGGAKDDSR